VNQWTTEVLGQSSKVLKQKITLMPFPTPHIRIKSSYKTTNKTKVQQNGI